MEPHLANRPDRSLAVHRVNSVFHVGQRGTTFLIKKLEENPVPFREAQRPHARLMVGRFEFLRLVPEVK